MNVATSAPDAIKILWKAGFFVNLKLQKEIEAELHKRGYNFGDATRMALARSKFLLSSGKHGEKGFIQKHPFTEEVNYERTKKS